MDAAAVAEKKQAALMSLFAAFFLTALKIAVGVYTGSLGVLAEAAHSALDLVAAGVTFFAIRISTRPADRHHAYGHGKAENLAALAETLLLLLTCLWIVHEAIDRLFFNPSEVRISIWAFAVLIISIVVDFNRSRMLARVAKKYNSQALEADALHFSTDILSSSVVLFGLLAVWCASFFAADGFWHGLLLRADSVAALIVAVIVAWVSFRLGARAIDVLLDAGDRDVFEKIEKAVATVPDVLRIKELRLRQSGPFIFADMELVLPSSVSLEYSHAVSEAVELAVQAVLPTADLSIHYEPERLQDSLAGQVQRLGLKHGLDVHGIEIYLADNIEYITLHAVLDPETLLGAAHKQVHAFEEELAGQGYKIFTHIEPRRPSRPSSSTAAQSLPAIAQEKINASIAEALKQAPLISGCHQMALLDLGAEWALSFHCYLPENTTVEQAHEMVTLVEKHLYKQVPELGRINIHTDVLEDKLPEL